MTRKSALKRSWVLRIGLGATQGDANAQTDLAEMLMRGIGGPVDDVEARRIYVLAAAQENAVAQTNLGFMLKSCSERERHSAEEELRREAEETAGSAVAKRSKKIWEK